MNDHVTLMQIECSVVNTTLVQLKSDALPESLRKKNNEELEPSKHQLYHTNKPIGNVTKRVYDNSRPKHNASKKINKLLADASPTDLQNSVNLSNAYSLNNQSIKAVDPSKDASFANYLFSKHESTRNDEKQRSNETVVPDLNVKNDTLP